MRIEQFVMAYQVEQDRLRALTPEGFTVLRPVLRVNAELRNHRRPYLEFNLPAEGFGKRGWVNIGHWTEPELSFERDGKTVIFRSGFLEFVFTPNGGQGGCPASRDNDGCFYADGAGWRFVPAEAVGSRMGFCDLLFAWKFAPGDASGVSVGGKTVPAYPSLKKKDYPPLPLTAQNAAHLPCEKLLGQYKVTFER